MKFNNQYFKLSLLLTPFLFSCGSNSSAPNCTATQFSATSLPNVGSRGTNANVMSVTVNGSLCGNAAYQYANEPCASVTICSPSTPTNCQTIDNILLDTGSYGLRLFSSVISVPLNPITNGSQNLAECVQYADGSSQWGQVEYAYVKLGNEPAVNMPIMVINSGYGTAPDICSSSQSTPDTDPQEAGFNGILGVGLFAQDCGADCVNDANNGQYYTCNGSNCSCGATVALAAQVQNPVALLPTDNNGVMLALPAVSSSNGVASLNGSLYLGIGTQTNNTPSGVKLYSTDTSGNFTTVFSAYSSTAMTSFIDSGSSQLAFPAPTASPLLPDCSVAHGSDWTGAFCPATVQSFTATNYSVSGSISGAVTFQIGNDYALLNALNTGVFNDLGSNSSSALVLSSSSIFDWGLPFFFGRNVYVGIAGVSSSLGTGPYWAY